MRRYILGRSSGGPGSELFKIDTLDSIYRLKTTIWDHPSRTATDRPKGYCLGLFKLELS